MKSVLSVLITFLLMFTFVPHQAIMPSRVLDSELIVYPQYDERIPRCFDYGVTVHQGDQSENLTVYNRNTSGEDIKVIDAQRCRCAAFIVLRATCFGRLNGYHFLC